MKFIKNIFWAVGRSVKRAAEAFWKLSVRSRSAILLCLIVILGLFVYFGQSPASQSTPPDTARRVSVANVKELSRDVSLFSLYGTVTSKSEATIRAESGGKIRAVYKKLGDYSAAGTVIAEFDNAAERAAVESAEGAYESANLGKDIAGISRDSSDSALSVAKTQALNIIASTYTGLDDAIRTKTDPAWRNPQTREAHLAPTISDAKLVIELESERINIETMLRAREARNRTLTSNSDLVSELTLIETEANTIKNYLDNLSLSFNRAIPDNSATVAQIETYKASAAGARLSVGGIIASISGVRSALNNSLAANLIAEKNSSSAMASSGSAADAQLKSALGNLRGAEARLEKTIIRSPISGTINSLSIETGDFIAPYTEVAVVSNNGALEVITYVTEEDARLLAIGASVAIEGGSSGVITRIAPALDPKNKKIEVRIGITSANKLINGQSVRTQITRKESSATKAPLQIPLSALKITPSGSVVFTVSEANTLIAHEVKGGALLGDRIVITEGLTTDMDIVTDARGLQEGMVVSVTK